MKKKTTAKSKRSEVGVRVRKKDYLLFKGIAREQEISLIDTFGMVVTEYKSNKF